MNPPEDEVVAVLFCPRLLTETTAPLTGSLLVNNDAAESPNPEAHERREAKDKQARVSRERPCTGSLFQERCLPVRKKSFRLPGNQGEVTERTLIACENFELSICRLERIPSLVFLNLKSQKLVYGMQSFGIGRGDSDPSRSRRLFI